jgi:hypothetical protein
MFSSGTQRKQWNCQAASISLHFHISYSHYRTHSTKSIPTHFLTTLGQLSIRINMAILEHFSACILIDGKPCQEYAVEEDEEQSETTSEEYPKITKYVEVVAGAPFTIRVEPTKSFEFGKGNSIRVGLYSDGEKLLGKIQQEAQVRAKEILKISRRTVDNGEDVRPFKFGNINFSKPSLSGTREATC